EGVVAGAWRRAAVAGEATRDHRVVGRRRLDPRLPVVAGAGHAVDQQQDRAGARLDEVQRLAVGLDGPRPRLGHAESRHFACHGWNLPSKAVEVSQRGGSVADFNTVALWQTLPKTPPTRTGRPAARWS